VCTPIRVIGLLLTKHFSICPSANATILPPPKPSVITCANGALVKREEDCPLPNYDFNASSSDITPSPTHPCPNAGYSCSECPDGYFCPQQTPAQSCPCEYGWACAHCDKNWFCVPGPSSVDDKSPVNSVAGLLANASA
jgi:hypothetical protein